MNRRIVAAAAAGVLIVVGLVAAFTDATTDQPPAVDPTDMPTAVVPITPGADPTPENPEGEAEDVDHEPGPAGEDHQEHVDDVVPDGAHDHEHGSAGQLAASLSPDDLAVAFEHAEAVAVAVTTQTDTEPLEDRDARVAPLMVGGARVPDGPHPSYEATVQPTVVNAAVPVDPGDPDLVGLRVSVHYDIARPLKSGQGRSFGVGDAEWLVHVTRTGDGAWRATSVELVGSTEYSTVE